MENLPDSIEGAIGDNNIALQRFIILLNHIQKQENTFHFR